MAETPGGPLVGFRLIQESKTTRGSRTHPGLYAAGRFADSMYLGESFSRGSRTHPGLYAVGRFADSLEFVGIRFPGFADSPRALCCRPLRGLFGICWHSFPGVRGLTPGFMPPSAARTRSAFRLVRDPCHSFVAQRNQRIDLRRAVGSGQYC